MVMVELVEFGKCLNLSNPLLLDDIIVSVLELLDGNLNPLLVL